ncbi:MAG: hypothetical protein JWL91_440 [Sphingomonas bacterium]|jgi:hypothetical protein|nr:hypothetical protein [Sphingomonas bacterium]
MGQLRTANKRRNRTILAEQARKVAASKPAAQPEIVAETV